MARGLALGLVGLAHLPWLAVQGRILWSYPHYQFVPFVPLGAAALAVRDSRLLGPLTPGDRRWSVGLLAASLLLMALAAVLWSPLFGTMAALTTLLALAQSWGGARLVQAMLPAWGFLWVAVRPPLGLDLDLIFALQSVATRWSSRVLDLLGVFHVAAGHVIELADRRLLVEEACSGIYSLFVALTATVFYVLWVRRGWLTSLLLFAAATAWVMVGNVFRIVTTAVLWSRWGIDINSGWKHELFGLVILVLTVGLILSTDSLVQGVLGGVRRVWSERLAWWFRQSWGTLRSRFARGRQGRATTAALPPAWPGAGPVPGPHAGSRRPRRADPLARDPQGLAGLLAGAGDVRPDRRRATGGRGAGGPVRSPGAGAEPRVAEGRRPARARGAVPARVVRRRTERHPGHPGRALAGVDLPLAPGDRGRVGRLPVRGLARGDRLLPGEGWTLQGRTVEPGEADQAGPRVAATMVKPLERHGLLVFGFDDERGEPLSSPSYRGCGAVLRERLSFGHMRLLGGQPSGRSRGGTVPSYQIQVLWDSEDPPTPADEAQARELFEQTRAAFRRAVSGSAASAGPAPHGRTT